MSPLACPPAAPSGAAPAVIERAGLTGRQIAQLTADHQAATDALRAPDVTADLTEAARDTARCLGLNPADPRILTLLLKLATRSYAHEHMDAAEAAREQAAIPLLAPMLGRTR